MAATRRQADALVTDINVTPLVDIMLVLLIIFMLTSTTIQAMDQPRTIDVDLPAAASAQVQPTRSLHVVLDGKGQLYLDGAALDRPALIAAIRARRVAEPSVTALVSADRAASHGTVIGLIDSVRSLGISDVAINTKAQDID